MQSLKMTAVLLVVGLFAAGTSAEIIDPANITPSAPYTFWLYDVDAINDPMDMVSATHHTMDKVQSDGGRNVWLDGGANGGPAGNGPHGDDTPHPTTGQAGLSWIQFSFDQPYDIQTINVWNTVMSNDGVNTWGERYGFKNTYFHYSTDNTNWTQLAYTAIPGAHDSGGVDGAATYEAGGYDADLSLDAGGINAQYVVLTAVDSYWDLGPVAYAGLGQVQFEIADSSTDFAGDFDSDGDVDGDDFLAWQNGFPISTGAALLDGDADADGDVDGDDFLIWQNQFPSPGTVAVTPEPASLALLGLGGLLMTLRRR